MFDQRCAVRIIQMKIVITLVTLVAFIAYNPSAWSVEQHATKAYTKDVGEPLFLTPYIDEGRTEEGKLAARVPPLLDNIISYSGFITVNKTTESNLFFWFFPSETDTANAPVGVWLQGGPGASSMFGLFAENGPFFVGPQLELQRRKHYWSQFMNFIYLDQPAGTGFSFTEKEEGYVNNQDEVGRDMVEFLRQFFLLFPEYGGNPFFPTGEDYAGKWVPEMGYAIHQYNPTATKKINLQGIALGDGLVDPYEMIDYANVLYWFGFIDLKTKEEFTQIQNKIKSLIDEKKYGEALEGYHSYFTDKATPYPGLVYNVTGIKVPYNLLRAPRDDPDGPLPQYLELSKVRNSVHVGNITWKDMTNQHVVKHLIVDQMLSSRKRLEVLADNYRVLIYNGQLDLLCPYTMTTNYIRKMNWKDVELYKNATRRFWYVGKDLAGYAKSGGLFTEMKIVVTVVVAIIACSPTAYAVKLKETKSFAEDVGEPLFLTPYIEEGKIEEGKLAAKVPPLLDNIISYSGYITVNKTTRSNLFFWFFPSETDPANAPVGVWLQGGPGASSMFGLFTENGPFSVTPQLGLIRNKYSWSQFMNYIYLDQPAGTGFSFTEKEEGYVNNQDEVGHDMVEFLRQFFLLFPEYSDNPFFPTGESYAGKWVPEMGYAIHKYNPTATKKINLQGIALGNGLVDPYEMIDTASVLYWFGFIDLKTKEEFTQIQNKIKSLIDEKKYGEALEGYNSYFTDNPTPYPGSVYNATGIRDPYNLLRAPRNDPDGPMDQYLELPKVRKSIHVGNITWNDMNQDVSRHLLLDQMLSIRPRLEVLVDYYRILLYNGQLDLLCPYTLTMNYVRKMSWKDVELYKNATRKFWYVGKDLAGYTKSGGLFTERCDRSRLEETLGEEIRPKLRRENKLIKMKLVTVIVVMICSHQAASLNLSQTNSFVGEDVGEPLFLTPYIEEGKIEDGKLAARVPPLLDNIISYSGYITVNKTTGSNLFFWFFPSETDPANAPVGVWLQGGPGATSMFGLFKENGPFSIGPQLELQRRKHYFSQFMNYIYLDQPAGTGFSFTEKELGYVNNQDEVGRDMVEFLRQFFLLFPEYSNNPFFPTGESYAGKWVPEMGYAIHQYNPTATKKINLHGIALGNGLVDPYEMIDYANVLYWFGFIDQKTKEEFTLIQKNIKSLIDQKKYIEANDLMYTYATDNPTNYSTLVYNKTGIKDYYNILRAPSAGLSVADLTKYLGLANLRKSIHVGNNRWVIINTDVARHLQADQMMSIIPRLEVLLNYYRVLLYSGQLDLICPYTLTMNYVHKMVWKDVDLYKNATRKFWYVGEDLAGYVKSGGLFTEVLVRNAGHMVPTDQPVWASDLIKKFVYNEPWDLKDYPLK